MLPADRLPPQPLPDNSPPLPYAELLTRARQQATAATEAFYVNRWGDLEEMARGLEQTARFLPRSTEIPLAHRDKLAAQADELARDAQRLREAARAQDVTQANSTMQRINLKVRELRLEGEPSRG
jgi:hypothetical protein